MDTSDVVTAAREIVSKSTFCLMITVGRDGEANARVMQPSAPTADWAVRFMTDRRCRKVAEIERTGQATLTYQNEPDFAYVTLVGRARIVDDVVVKQAVWQPGSYKWHPGGPTDPNVVLIDFTTDRIELWSSRHRLTPDPTKGLWAVCLTRAAGGWEQSATAP